MHSNEEREALKPCPFCGSEPVWDSHPWIRFLRCPNESCEIQGPHKHDDASAITAWNTRANLPAQEGDAVKRVMTNRMAMKEALCEFAIANGAKFDEVTLVEKEAHEGTALRWEYSIQKTPPIVLPTPQPADGQQIHPASLAPNPDNHDPRVRLTDEGDAQTASMNRHAAPVDARDGGGQPADGFTQDVEKSNE